MQSFQELYVKLNQQQQDAVNAIEGPVMVIAGPGTGKTQILATRILNILSNLQMLLAYRLFLQKLMLLLMHIPILNMIS